MFPNIPLTSKAPLRVFISYRREDSSHVTGRIYDRLSEEFGPDNVFKDVDSIPLGVDFRKILHDAVGQSDVVLVVIGEQWLNACDERGRRRLDDDSDFVRIEIEAALTRNISIIPLLVGRTPMPRSKELPTTLERLAFFNGAPVRPDPDFHSDMTRVIHAVEKVETGKANVNAGIPKELEEFLLNMKPKAE